jgi:hypothetical protein
VKLNRLLAREVVYARAPGPADRDNQTPLPPDDSYHPGLPPSIFSMAATGMVALFKHRSSPALQIEFALGCARIRVPQPWPGSRCSTTHQSNHSRRARGRRVVPAAAQSLPGERCLQPLFDHSLDGSPTPSSAITSTVSKTGVEKQIVGRTEQHLRGIAGHGVVFRPGPPTPESGRLNIAGTISP